MPVITIGAYGQFHENSPYKTEQLNIIIGKKDHYHYQKAKNFASELKKNNISVRVYEHSDGHCVPYDILKKSIENILKKTNKIGPN